MKITRTCIEEHTDGTITFAVTVPQSSVSELLAALPLPGVEHDVIISRLNPITGADAEKQKPEPIRVQAQGFDAMKRMGDDHVKWNQLINWPRFQQYALTNKIAGDTEDGLVAAKRVVTHSERYDAQALIDTYLKWHAAKYGTDKEALPWQ